MQLCRRFLPLGLLLIVGCAESTSQADAPVTAERKVAAVDDLAPVRPADDDWPWWFGLNYNNIAALGQDPPLRWSETENVVWKIDVPGRGHGSPCPMTPSSGDVVCKHFAGGAMQWHKATFSELRTANRQNPSLEIDILKLEIACFAEA